MFKTQQIINIFASIFVIFIVLRITEFLKTLPQCACYAEKSGKTNNLDKIEFLEKFVIFLALVKIAHAVYAMFTKSESKESVRESPYMLFMLVLITAVYTFFTYNVYEHQKSAGSQCECADKWQQNVIYFQALIYALIVAMIFVLGLMMLSTGTVGESNFRRVIALLAVFISGLGIFSFFGGNMNIFLEQVMGHFRQIEGFSDFSPNAETNCSGSCPCKK